MVDGEEIYIIEATCETSSECCTYGAWLKFEGARDKLAELVKVAPFNEESYIDLDEGIAKSDPNYESDEYIDYVIQKLPILDDLETELPY